MPRTGREPLPRDEARITPYQALTKIRTEERIEICRATLYGWMTRGVYVDGERVKLESAVVGGSVFTSEPAMRRFLDRMNPRGPKGPRQ